LNKKVNAFDLTKHYSKIGGIHLLDAQASVDSNKGLVENIF
jgi:hypothetical protein